MYRIFFKRLFDISVSLCALIVLAPIFLVTIIWLCFINGESGVFFFQQRPGRNEKIFKVIKFKTMTE